MTAANPEPLVKSRGGRPSAAMAGQIKTNILDIASRLFLQQGFEAVSIEAVAKTAGISKRTFYHRFKDKAELFAAVMHHLAETIRPPQEAHLFEGKNAQAVLQQLAQAILHSALLPEALALHRLLLTEVTRFPELAEVMSASSIRQEAIDRIAQFLESEIRKGSIAARNARFLAEQFLDMVMSAAQRRAMGLGQPFTPAEQNQWAQDAVLLFLNGCRMPQK
jgi:TetR/AcrR family transcriptional regulator, mexJK operon transcriptional repressor